MAMSFSTEMDSEYINSVSHQVCIPTTELCNYSHRQYANEWAVVQEISTKIKKPESKILSNILVVSMILISEPDIILKIFKNQVQHYIKKIL